jgi:hypothetical protein
MQTKEKPTILDYCQYLISSQINYTITHLADHLQKWSHDTLRRYLNNERVTASDLWKNVSKIIQVDEEGFIIFDDTVIDKNFSYDIEVVKYQYSGTTHKVIKGIGVVNCVYVNPKTDQFWVVDYRIYHPDTDGKSKIEHVKDMINNLLFHKKLPFKTILMDKWYASAPMMMFINSLNKIFYCPIVSSRLVDDTGGIEKYKRVTALEWSKEELCKGKIVKIKKFPGSEKVKLFRVTDKNGTEYIATNDIDQNSSDIAKKMCDIRWKVEEFHRELKQVTGIERCQCRKARIQRNHIGCAILAWVRLKHLAYQDGVTIYQLKFGQLKNYLTNELVNPSVKMAFA